MSTREQLDEIYKLLFERFGPQHWWPGDNQFEIIIGAILTQNTSWTNVEKAINNLKTADALSADALYKMDIDSLAALIKPAGYFNVKAKRLKNFLAWLFEDYDGKLENVEQLSTQRLREELLNIKGVGNETADSILLYAFERPIFVVDAYTARVAIRHGLIGTGCDYEQLQQTFQSNLIDDVKTFNEFHALLVKVGNEYCKPKARCEGCPLEQLPHNPEPI
ncbi:MAG: endonuclease III domain-containing protein [Phycisphaerae bacterium]|jgi:endonuclease-3 related protein